MRVYVAGPITKGDQFVNVRQAILAADALLAVGHAPYCPHLTAFWHTLSPHTWEAWLALDEAWLRLCDAVVRLPGESTGADREVTLAETLGIPVFQGIEAFLAEHPS